MNSQLNVTHDGAESGRVAIIGISGRLDASTIGQLERVLASAQLSNPRITIVDMAGLQYVSSSGLRVLLSARAAARKTGSDVLLCALTPPVQEVFDMVGFSAVFGIFATRADALAAASHITG